MASSTPPGGHSRTINVLLWVAQVLIAVMFIMSGYLKFMTPIPELAKMMPWTGQLPVGFVRFIGVVDFTGGVGILLPALTRIQPRLTVLAALGCTVLQILALLFHLSRGEANVTPLNIVLLTLSVFVLWGRGKRAPIVPRIARA
jgi:uncharacterized membrane protein YphA (DoxX/SURF4 family)